MKKALILFIVGIFLFPAVTSASPINGPCYRHGGVNCTLSSPGNLLCSDGARSNEDSYYNVCRNKEPIVCDDESDLAAIRARNFNQGATGSGFDTTSLAKCQAEIDRAKSGTPSGLNYRSFPPIEFDRESYINNELVKACKKAYGDVAVFDTYAKDCICPSGYDLTTVDGDKECRKPIQVILEPMTDAEGLKTCIHISGPYATLERKSGNSAICGCKEGYVLDRETAKCESVSPTPTVKPVVQPTTHKEPVVKPKPVSAVKEEVKVVEDLTGTTTQIKQGVRVTEKPPVYKRVFSWFTNFLSL